MIFLLDGARTDVVRRLLDEGAWPNIRRRLVEPGSYREAVTCFPSTTGPAYVPFISGLFPGRCNLPGIRWLDRREYESTTFSLNRFRSYVGIESYLMNRDLSPDTVTLFDLLPGGRAVFSPVSSRNGAQADRGRIRKAVLFTYAHYTEHWEAVDWAARRRTMQAVEDGAPIVFSAFMAVDELSHHIDPLHERVLKVYRAFDRFVGDVCACLQDRGQLEETFLAIVSDHGMTPLQKHFELTEFFESRGLRTLAYPWILRHWRSAACAVMVSGNAMAHVYLKRRDRWGDPLNDREIETLQPGLLDALVDRPEVDFVSMRAAGGGVRLLGRKGRARLSRSGRGLDYRPEAGNPLEIKAGTYGDPETALRRTFDTRYPDAPVQLDQIFSSGRTGDLVVSAAEGCDLRFKHEHPEHHASHGSFIQRHMIVPLICNIRLQPGPIRTADLFPTILGSMGKAVPEGLDGVSRQARVRR